ncbi:MAG: beta-lactamase family protein [marine benthic group bacterium]|jgi:CubicO group peptidase (beta-lactamase class C family)|nr:beta-lactamase family protein [Candidatus Benthicola marisminoris]
MRAVTLVVALSCLVAPADANAQQGWPRGAPSDAGLDPAPLTELSAEVLAGDFGYIDRMLVVADGRLVFDERFENDYAEISRGRSGPIGCGVDACEAPGDVHDFNYLHPDRHPFYRGREVHTLQSVTKSVTSTLIGIAIQRGLIAGVDVPVFDLLPSYDLSALDPRVRDATLEDLLTMRIGIEWHETDRPLDDTNTTLQLEKSDNWVRFTLSQPADSDPGAMWAYNSGASHLMSAIIGETTGLSTAEFAEAYLFGPLGIQDYHWKQDPQGLQDTEGGLYLAAEDLARIGWLYLQDGVWEGERLLPEGWVTAATARQVDDVAPLNPNWNWGYGYQWWRLDASDLAVWAGLGFGGQNLLVIPERGLVGVINSWNVFGPKPPLVIPFIDAMIAASDGD